MLGQLLFDAAVLALLPTHHAAMGLRMQHARTAGCWLFSGGESHVQ